MKLIIVAIDTYDLDSFINEDTFYDSYLFEDSKGFTSMEYAHINSLENAYLLINYIFQGRNDFNEIFKNESLLIIDLSKIKKNVMTFENLENTYKDWLKKSKKENSMDEYGTLLGLIGYVSRHLDKKYLLLRLNLS